jgi:two-component system OmpR family response regulator
VRVLVVEDEASLAKQLIAALHRAGYAVDHAGDGERADLLGRDERYDAVVLDLGLPQSRRGHACAGADGARKLA